MTCTAMKRTAMKLTALKRNRPAWPESAAGEPRLDDMLGDPIVRALMARDGVKEGELRRLLAAAQLGSSSLSQ